jgi:hypothetical protein
MRWFLFLPIDFSRVFFGMVRWYQFSEDKLWFFRPYLHSDGASRADERHVESSVCWISLDLVDFMFVGVVPRMSLLLFGVKTNSRLQAQMINIIYVTLGNVIQ